MKDIATLKSINEICNKYGLKAKKQYGQNFLIDANTVNKIAKMACDKDGISVEIGPGIGSLTQMLSRYSKYVYAHEIDERLFEVLDDTLKDCDNVEIIKGDFLKVNFKDMPYYGKDIVVCANLPYYITTPILFKLFESNLKIKAIYVMVQKEVALRFKAEVNTADYNALSLIVQYLYDVKLEMNISKNVFMPKPKVDSAIVSFKPHPKRAIDEKKFFNLLKLSFKQRRKTLYNNLKEAIEVDKILKAFNTLKLSKEVRAQELDLNMYLQLFEVLYA